MKMLCRIILGAVLPCTAAAIAATGFAETTVVERPDAAATNSFYVGNRPPLQPSRFLKLPISAITPRGWLRRQLELEADGMLGHLQEISKFLKFEGNGWVEPTQKNGWEELPYWLKGYGDLGYVLRDEKIMAQARRWLDAILATQQADGWFGPLGLKTSFQGKADMWPHMPVLNALQSFHEFSGDARVLPFMTKYAQWQNALPPDRFGAGYWPKMRFGDNLESVYWLYNRTGDPWLLDLARKIHENMADWTSDVPNWHNVNIAECFREPGEFWLHAGDAKFLDAAERNYRKVMDLYGQVPGGGFGGDENCRPGFGDPRQGIETCGIVEFMHSFQMLTRISANPLWTDRCEELALNSLPAALTPDLKALHYITSPNQVQLDRGNKAPSTQNRGTLFSYSPHGYRCCQHNHGMGWPYYAEELWLATADNGLCASLYAASEVRAKVGDGTGITIIEETDYPFGDTIRLKLSARKSVTFPLYLRVPRWCDATEVQINGRAIEVHARPLSYIVLRRAWADGDTVTLRLPMRIAVRTWAKNKNAVSVDYGPLTFSLKIAEKWQRYGSSEAWPEWEVFPDSPWNYGLVLDAREPAKSFDILRKPGPLAAQPFTHDGTPIELRAKARKIPNWQMDRLHCVGLLQPSPARSDEPEETVTLIPMGTARLRIASFPTIGAGPDAHEWAAPPRPAFTASASHCNHGDTVDALNDGLEPKNSNDHGIPRFTWWPHKGTSEWVQYDFQRPKKTSATEVYWFDDTGHGGCRVPQSWRLLYKDGDQWKPVAASADYGVKRDQFNRVTFPPVTTTALRLEVQLQPKFSGGILEWRMRE